MITSIDIEIILTGHNSLSKSSLITLVEKYLEDQKVRPNTLLSNFNTERDTFHSLVKFIIIGGVSNSTQTENNTVLDLKTLKVNWFVYSLNSDGISTHTECDDEGGEITIATHQTLPAKELFTLWENLYYDSNIKENLLRYAKTMMEFSKKGINPNIVSCNRVILLHGPPGTGKTSLCKALAQKLTIRMADAYSSGLLIEINSHSLFSKWFSESGKLVTNMFTKIKDICENENILVCVLMDEVESLAHARNQCISGNEPSDAVRVVNAMLTQIDQIKRYPNVLILATSNMTEAIDLAFVDRADIKQYLGLPSVPAIHKVYQSCLMELINVNIIRSNHHVIMNNTADMVRQHNLSEENHEYSQQLLKICEKSVGLSGRSLRKIPFLAHALFLNSSTVAHMGEFLDAMDMAVEKEHLDQKMFTMKS